MRKGKKCTDCYYYEKCSGRRICAFYDPITDCGEALSTRDVIENGRREFRLEWNKYIAQNDNKEIYCTDSELRLPHHGE